MKNLLLLFVPLFLSNSSFSQTEISIKYRDTIRFAPDSSYSRALVKVKNNLYFGTSKNGVVCVDLKSKEVKDIILPNKGEFRDISYYKGKITAIESGDNGYISISSGNNATTRQEFRAEFFDDLVTNKNGSIVLADPKSGYFILHYFPKSKKKKRPYIPRIRAFKNEACYAASGTTAQLYGNQYSFVSGGGSSARFHSFSLVDSASYFVSDLPLKLGEGAGPFSIFQLNEKQLIVVGGDYTKSTDTLGTCAISLDGGKKWSKPVHSPNGYRSCVVGNKQFVFCCGTSGIDYSLDFGQTWTKFVEGNFCALFLEGENLYATSNKGFCIDFQFEIED